MASNFQSYVYSSIGTSNTTVLTATTTTTVIGFSMSNTTTLPITASAILSKSGGSSVFVVKNAPIPSGGALVLVGGDQKIVMKTGDTLKVSANTASSVDTIISTLEM